ncbi:MAG TPA: hypothetical protein VJV78_38450 [Polyangiales bacterium]|nr:hypothetical protein [Polyangiales bacterium]
MRTQPTWIAVFLSSWLLTSSAAAQRTPISETSGLAIGVSAPTGAALLGVRVDYYLQLPDSLFRVGAHAAIGATVESSPVKPTTAFGLMGSWGPQHRVFLEALVGTLEWLTISLHGRPVADSMNWGGQLLAGYEFMSLIGVYVRTGLGAMYVWEPTLRPPNSRWDVAVKLVDVGFKLW